MKITAVVVREQRTTFAVVVVKRSAMQSPNRDATQRSFQPLFPGMQVVLMSQDHQGVPTFWGRRDISQFLAGIHPARLPWREYRIAS